MSRTTVRVLDEEKFKRKMDIIGIHRTDNIIFKDVICYVQQDIESGDIFIEFDTGLSTREYYQALGFVCDYIKRKRGRSSHSGPAKSKASEKTYTGKK